MAGITGQGTTFNLPNYTGELFSVTPADTPFLAAIGGLTGGKAVQNTQFEWQGYDLRAAGQNTRVEGANAPAPEERVRFNVTNVVQVHQETVETTYTKNATTGQFSGLNSNQAGLGGNEQTWQVTQMLKQIARDAEYSFIRGTYNLPADNTTARRTRGILAAITTNNITAPDADAAVAGLQPSPLTEALVLNLMQSVWENGGIQEEESATLMVNAFQKRQLTRIFVTDRGFQEQSRNVAGVNVQTIETDFGRVNIMLNRYMPAGELAVVSLEECAPVFLYIPEKGFLFQEELAKVGAADRTQIYGEIGLEYGNERKHGRITNLTTA